MHEAQLHSDNCFLTLTYADEFLPDGGTLVKKDFQNFMKRLRKRNPGKRISYYHCGEYGETTRRPHYHACLFNHDFGDKLLFKRKGGISVYTSATLSELWPFGFSTVGALTFESAAYTARYVMKKITGEMAERHYQVVDADGVIHQLQPEYVTMSLRPAIGKGWYDEFHEDVYPDDFVVMRGREMKPPKYYDRLYELADPEGHAARKEERLKSARRNADNATPERLKARETVTKAKLSQLKREIE